MYFAGDTGREETKAGRGVACGSPEQVAKVAPDSHDAGPGGADGPGIEWPGDGMMPVRAAGYLAARGRQYGWYGGSG